MSSMEKLPVDKKMETVTPRDPQGRVALMLCESLIHLLVEESVIAKQKALEAIEGVVELAREMAERETATSERRRSAVLAETIAASFMVKD